MFKRLRTNIPLSWKRVIALVMALTAVAAMGTVGSAQSLANPLDLLRTAATQQNAPVQNPTIIDIRFKSTQYLTDDEILGALEHIVLGQPFDEAGAEKDLAALEQLAIEKHGGPVFHDIKGKTIPISTGTIVELEFVEAFRIPEFTVDIDVLSEEWFVTAVGFEPGMPDTMLWDGIEQAFARAHDEEGFLLDLNPMTDIQIDPQTGAVHITVRALRLSEVRFEGNQKTRDYVIEREIKAVPGEPFNWRVIEGDMRRLFHLGFFQNVVPPEIEWDLGDDPNERPDLKVTYILEERQTGSAGFGAGYSSSSGLMGYVEVSDDNLFGRGQQAGLRWEFGQKESSYDLSFREPNVMGSGISTGFNLYNQANRGLKDKDNKEYDLRSVGGNLSLGYRFTDFLRGDMQYRLENQRTTYESEPTQTRQLRSLLLGISGDTTNQPFYPTSGLRYNISAENAGNFLGGDLDFTKYRGSISTYLRVGSNDQVIALRLMGGMSANGLPSSEVFRVGGADSVRGYGYGQMQGDTQLVANAEYRFHISDLVQGVVFADTGQAWQHDEPIDLSQLRTAYGIGVRVETPLGLMRLDYGFGDEGGRAFFSLGPTF